MEDISWHMSWISQESTNFELINPKTEKKGKHDFYISIQGLLRQNLGARYSKQIILPSLFKVFYSVFHEIEIKGI